MYGGGATAITLVIVVSFVGGVHLGTPFDAYVYCPINKLPA